jgi:CBS domain-containing protein
MRCRDIMKRDVDCCWADDSVAEAASRMRARGVGFLPVCDATGEVIGTITDRDLTIRVLADCLHPIHTKIGDVMTPGVVAVSPDASLRDAEELMESHRKSRIVCVNRWRQPVGIISLSDIAEHEPFWRVAHVMRTVAQRENAT